MLNWDWRRSIIICQTYYTRKQSITTGGSRFKLVTGHKTVTMGVVYRCPNITKESNEKIRNAIRGLSKGDCNGDFNSVGYSINN